MTREKSGILIMIDDQPTDLADVTWVEVAPCGCTSGATVAWLPKPYDVVKVTVDQAADDYYETAAVRKQSEKRGFTIKAVPLATFTISNCPHIPKWGYERPTPPDMKWAASKWGRGSKVLHLVPAEAVDPEAENGRRPTLDAAPLCAPKRSDWGWSNIWAEGQADCEKCIAAASLQGVLL